MDADEMNDAAQALASVERAVVRLRSMAAAIFAADAASGLFEAQPADGAQAGAATERT